MAARFIPEALIPVLHEDLIQRYGGTPGIRDAGLLSSALAQPKMTMGRAFLHRTLFDKAAAYGYHICKNHPFIDGNKRVAFVLMDIFLQLNGKELRATEKEAYELVMSLADGRLSKRRLASWLKDHSR